MYHQFDGWKDLRFEKPEYLVCILAFDPDTKSVYAAYQEDNGVFYQWFPGDDFGAEVALGFEFTLWCYPAYPEGE